MLYISGERETLKELKEKEGYDGPLSVYEQLFAEANPFLVKKYPNYKKCLPPYTPLFLVTVEAFNPATKMETQETIDRFSLKEKKALRELQEERHDDVTTQLTLSAIMESFQDYAKAARQALKTPLILTPWNEFNSSLTDKHLFKMMGETSSRASDLLAKRPSFVLRDELYEMMLAKDDLCRRIYLLKNKYDKEAVAARKSLFKEVERLNQEIRKLLPKKIKDAQSKYVHRLFTDAERAKMRKAVSSTRSAGRMRLSTVNLDVLNKSGLGRLRTVISEMKMLGQGINKGAKMLNWGVVAYDTVDAYMSGKNFARTFFAGATSVVVASELAAAAGGTTALGGLVIGSLVGDAAIGTTILVCSPVIGWVVLLVAGVAIGGYVSYKSKSAAEGIWDLAEDVSGKIATETSKAMEWTHEWFKKAWDEKATWLPKYYGDEE